IFYEESMRIPMIISWPEKITPRKEEQLMIGFADLYPSLLSMMGFQKEIPETVQTFDLSKQILTGKGNKEVVQPYYFIQYDNQTTGYRGLRTNTHTYVVHAADGKTDEVLLFDRQEDPYQMNNIASKQPQLIRSFERQLKKWLIATNDPFANYLP
ncbi:MAG: sulfatase, partial [Bacteroides sp.]